MTTFFDTASVPLQQQSMSSHDAIDALMIGMFEALRFGCAPQQDCPDTPVAISRHRGDHCFDLVDQIGLGLRWSTKGLAMDALLRPAMLDRATLSTSHTAFIENRPSATTATATVVFLSQRRLREPP